MPTTLDRLLSEKPEMFMGLYRIGEPRRPEITFQVENVAAIRRDGMAMLEGHYDEIAQFKEVQELDPDWDAYETLERNGKLWVMTVRDSGLLVGYIVMIMGRNLHYKKLMMATEDLHFIMPKYRKGMTGYRLLAKAKQAMTDKGINMAIWRTKAAKSHGALFERLGGVLSDLVYAMVLRR